MGKHLGSLRLDWLNERPTPALSAKVMAIAYGQLSGETTIIKRHKGNGIANELQ